MLFRGLCAFPVTPGDDDGIVDAPAMRALVRRLVASGVDSIGVLGSTGSAPYFSRAERRRTIECGVDEAAGRLPVMAGIGALRTSEAVCLGQDAAAIGADAVLLAPVSYTPLTEEEVFRHVAAVADAVDLPLCLYHNPGTTNFTFTPALIGRLSRVARIVAVKTPAPDPAAMDPRAGPGRDGGGIGDPSRRNGTRFFHWRRGRCQGGRGPPGRLPGLVQCTFRHTARALRPHPAGGPIRRFRPDQGAERVAPAAVGCVHSA
jgi:hypothetical protein